MGKNTEIDLIAFQKNIAEGLGDINGSISFLGDELKYLKLEVKKGAAATAELERTLDTEALETLYKGVSEANWVELRTQVEEAVKSSQSDHTKHLMRLDDQTEVLKKQLNLLNIEISELESKRSCLDWSLSRIERLQFLLGRFIIGFGAVVGLALVFGVYLIR